MYTKLPVTKLSDKQYAEGILAARERFGDEVFGRVMQKIKETIDSGFVVNEMACLIFDTEEEEQCFELMSRVTGAKTIKVNDTGMA